MRFVVPVDRDHRSVAEGEEIDVSVTEDLEGDMTVTVLRVTDFAHLHDHRLGALHAANGLVEGHGSGWTVVVLGVHGLRKSYGDVVALDGVDLEIGAGEICGLLGPNGAGKTTLVSIVAGLRDADEGRVVVNGVDALKDSADARRFIGLAP